MESITRQELTQVEIIRPSNKVSESSINLIQPRDVIHNQYNIKIYSQQNPQIH